MILLDERPPDDALHAAAVLHVRKHARRAIRARRATPVDLAMLFGVDLERDLRKGFRAALADPDPIARAAEVVAARRGGATVIELGRDAVHVARCHAWLQRRRDTEPALSSILATDLATLVTLSEAIDLATASAPADAPGAAIPVLIQGETGTGKELLASALHEIWKRAHGRGTAIYPVHVAGLPPDLVNDELFGHVRGAFTDARAERPGRLELADGGTVLIDEVGDLPADAQLRLLRVLEDQKVSRIGENKQRQLQVRVLAATWHDLPELVAAGTFRRDLLHRLQVGVLRLPPLRERPGAFRQVVPQMLKRLGQTSDPAITRSAQDALALHAWPGNLRELAGALRMALASAGGGTVRLEDLPVPLQTAYLGQPLHARAVGFLSDEADGQPMTHALAEWRVAQIEADLRRAAEGRRASSQAREVLDFFKAVPDPSPDHQRGQEAVEGLIHTETVAARERWILRAWERIAAAEPHVAVVSAVQASVARARARAVDARAQFEASRAQKSWTASPWWRLYHEIRRLPVFAGEDTRPLLRFVTTAAKLAASMDPDSVAHVRGMLVQDGLRGLRERAAQALKNGNAETRGAPPPSVADYRRWTADDWEGLLEAYPTKAAASRAIGVDPKTITKYLRELGIVEHWGISHAATPPAHATNGSPSEASVATTSSVPVRVGQPSACDEASCQKTEGG